MGQSPGRVSFFAEVLRPARAFRADPNYPFEKSKIINARTGEENRYRKTMVTMPTQKCQERPSEAVFAVTRLVAWVALPKS